MTQKREKGPKGKFRRTFLHHLYKKGIDLFIPNTLQINQKKPEKREKAEKSLKIKRKQQRKKLKEEKEERRTGKNETGVSIFHIN